MGAVVTAGIGTVCDSLYEISLSYERAREAVSYRVLYGTKRAINIGEIVPKEQIKPVQSEESRMQMLFRAIRIGDSAEIERAAHGEMEKLHKNTETMSQYNLATMVDFLSSVQIIRWISIKYPVICRIFTKKYRRWMRVH